MYSRDWNFGCHSDFATSRQNLGTILVNKVLQKIVKTKNTFNKTYSTNHIFLVEIGIFLQISDIKSWP